MTDTHAIPPNLRDDLLTGALEIATYLGWDKRRVYYACDRGYLPISRVGSIIVARKSELATALSANTEAA